MKKDQYRDLMQSTLSEELYRHSLGTAEAAASLAGHYGADVEKAYIAGLLHDYAKQYSKEVMYRKADQLGLKLDPIIEHESKLLHAPLGAVLLRTEIGVEDPEILEAISDHTTGQEFMSLLGKVLYLADFIEESRWVKGVEAVRAVAYLDLDQALIAAIDNTICSVLSRGLVLHPQSVAFRNRLIMKANIS
jgi:predicted HD superfamily hydrolase involved in NAD metabolism